ncbi:von Willebrand factor A domain-containing protein 5B1 [Pristis pectinata]|uniref:von Willebrand factor A domain-containing protein 5B1 n=1 Tax=Pristis pectinata TaxID=685728 RepID=UPI00223DA201|nr:von Willebrand factor A domain-containing protein 5B1 [Pristis pectinata]
MQREIRFKPDVVLTWSNTQSAGGTQRIRDHLQRQTIAGFGLRWKERYCSKMPGLINRENNQNLLLSSSEVTSCMTGYTLGMSASLTYTNMEDHSVEGLFIYPVDEFTTVVGFEATVSGRIITLQIKDKAKLDDGYFDCSNISSGTFQNGSGRIVLDEDLERTVFAVNLGLITPLETVTVLISTSLELQTLPNGTIRLVVPSVYVPTLVTLGTDSQTAAENQLKRKDRQRCCTNHQNHKESGNQFCLAKRLEDEVTNAIVYDFSFHLEIRAPCLLAGVESPTHSIRADADPSALCASSVMITLAEKHTFDRPVEIIIHPSEPHVPHILMEGGDMTPDEYEQHLKGKSDFIKGTKKDPSSEKKNEIIRKRLNKDIGHHPVIMLNFCPDLKTAHPDLRMAQGEFIFLIDRSGSMSGVNINRVKEAMLVILKSLVPSCLFNIIGFGSTFRTLFPASRSYNEETLAVACDYMRRVRADMGSTNMLSPLSWIFRQPVHRGHPRLLFLLTDGSVSNAGKVINLIRNHAQTSRCYSFGIGQNASRRLVLGLASASKGAAEFLDEGERLQPKMVKSLKKAMAPFLSDVTVDWFLPETTEMLPSPVGTSFVFPGDRLIEYCIVCDTSRYHSNLKSNEEWRCSQTWSQQSSSSVFYHSQEEDPDNWRGCRDSPLEATSVNEDPRKEGVDTKTTPRRRAFSSNCIGRQRASKRGFTPSDPGSAFNKNPLRRARAQQLVGRSSPERLSPSPGDFQRDGASSCTSTTGSRLAGKTRPYLLHQNCVSNSQDLELPQAQSSVHQGPTARSMVPCEGSLTSRSSTESASISSSTEPGCFHYRSSTLEDESSFELQEQSVSCNAGSLQCKFDCKAVISGLLCGKVVQWEVTFDLQSLLYRRTNCKSSQEDMWNETIHQLAAKSLIRDFEQMAEKESEIEHGSGRRYQLNAIQTSKACNIISKYTAFVPVYLDNKEYLPNIIEYSNSAVGSKPNNYRRSHSGSRRHRGYSGGLGHSQSEYGSDGAEDGLSILTMEDNKQSPCTSPSSSGWERSTEGTDQTNGRKEVTACRSTESLFTAAKLSFNKTRMLSLAAKGFMSRSPSKMSESICEPETENNDYMPLVNLQLASGAFLLSPAFCEAINIPMEQLKWTSPFMCHRSSVSPTSHTHSSSFAGKGAAQEKEPTESSHQTEAANVGTLSYLGIDGVGAESKKIRSRHFSSSLVEIQSRVTSGSCELLPPPVTVRRSSSPGNPQASSTLLAGGASDLSAGSSPFLTTPSEFQQPLDAEGAIWSTAVALAWLEHRSAAYFIEWELVAAKACMWLDAQQIPEARELASVKASARQLFVLLRHWDENLQLNMLCYNPNSV